jgi:hypothetical protein
LEIISRAVKRGADIPLGEPANEVLYLEFGVQYNVLRLRIEPVDSFQQQTHGGIAKLVSGLEDTVIADSVIWVNASLSKLIIEMSFGHLNF